MCPFTIPEGSARWREPYWVPKDRHVAPQVDLFDTVGPRNFILARISALLLLEKGRKEIKKLGFCHEMLVFFAAVVLVLTSLDDGDDTNTSTTHREPRGLLGPRDKNDSYCGTGNAITAGLPLYLSAVPPVMKKKPVLACLRGSRQTHHCFP